jgi:hypothetical protein
MLLATYSISLFATLSLKRDGRRNGGYFLAQDVVIPCFCHCPFKERRKENGKYFLTQCGHPILLPLSL